MNYNLNEDKTEDATPYKIEKYKKNGEIKYSYDLNSFFILLFFFFFIFINKKIIFLYFLKLFISSLTFQNNTIDKYQKLFIFLLQHIKIFILFFSILFSGIFFILIFSPILIYGEIVRIKFIKFNLNFIDIVNNFKKKKFQI